MTDSARVTFVDAVAEGFRRARDVRGVSTRSEFWYWMLFAVLVSVVLMTIDAVFLTSTVPDLPNDLSLIDGSQIRALIDAAIHDTVWSVASLGSVALFVPTLTVTVRRFRDAGSSAVMGWIVSVVNPITTVAVLWLGYSMSYDIDSLSTDTPNMGLGIAVLGMLALSVANVAAYVIMLVVATRPSRAVAGPRATPQPID
jgi:uncharacterized membrane protein YhaH (DUF805 family)